MASPFLFGPTNYAASGTAFLYSATENPEYPVAHLLDPTRPLLPYRSTATTQTDVRIDLGSAQPVRAIALFYTNYTSVQFFADNDPAFGSADFSSGTLTIRRNWWNQRFSLQYIFATPQTNRYWLLRIPAQTPVDLATYFSTGGCYIGTLADLPAETDPYPGGLEWDEDHAPEEAIHYLRTQSGGLQTLHLQDAPKTVLSYSRIAHVNAASPGTGDALELWVSLDFSMRRPFLWALQYGNSAEVWMMRKTSQSTWPISFPVSRSPMVLEECIGP